MLFCNREMNRLQNILISQIRNRNQNREIGMHRTGTVGTEKAFNDNQWWPDPGGVGGATPPQ
jgi:hypothetical protein